MLTAVKGGVLAMLASSRALLRLCVPPVPLRALDRHCARCCLGGGGSGEGMAVSGFTRKGTCTEESRGY